MKHKAFEAWIFSDDDFPRGQQQALYEHVRACDACYLLEKKWSQVERLIAAEPQARPAPGFAHRWQARLEMDTRRASRRQSLAMLGVTSAGAGIFLLLSGWQVVAGAAQAIASLSLWTPGAAWPWTLAYNVSGAASTISAPLVPILPTLFVMAFFAALGAGGWLWLKMFRTLARVQGYTKWA